MARDDRYALAALAAQALAGIVESAALRVPLAPAEGKFVKRAAFAVAAVVAPAVRTAADVAAIGVKLAETMGTIRAAAAPQDVAPILYDAASASAACVPAFASPARTRQAALARRLAESLEAAWLGHAFVAEAQALPGDRQAAIAARKRIAEAMDRRLDRIAANTGRAVVDRLGEVARVASEHIAKVAADLRPVVRVSTARSVPSTALAFALYGDPARAPDLVARNKVATPLFMPVSIDALAPDA